MMKKAIMISLLGLIWAASLCAVEVEVVGVINEPLSPRFLAIDDQQIYFSEPTSVHIYSLKDFKKITQFGKAGSGPEEFQSGGRGESALVLIPRLDQLLVSALGKINYYQKNGSFIKTVKIQTGIMGFMFYPLEKGFVGASMSPGEKGGMIFTVNVFDEAFNKQVELGRTPMDFGAGKFNLFDMNRRMMYMVADNKIYLLSEDDKQILIRSDKGEILGKIDLAFEKIPLTKADIEQIISGMSKGVPAAQLEQFKKMLAFPDFYPPIINILLDNNLLYLTTWKKKENSHLLAIYDLKTGKKIKELFVPLHFITGIQPFPFVYNRGYFYTFHETVDEDEPDEVQLKLVRMKVM